MLTLRTPLVHCAWSVLYRVRLPLSFLVLPVVLLFMSFGCVTALLGLAPHVTGLSLSLLGASASVCACSSLGRLCRR